MKIFDFTDGKKGAFITDVGRVRYFGHGLVDGLKHKVGRYQFHSCFVADLEYRAGDIEKHFGVKAVCFCYPGQGDSWDWMFCSDLVTPDAVCDKCHCPITKCCCVPETIEDAAGQEWRIDFGFLQSVLGVQCAVDGSGKVYDIYTREYLGFYFDIVREHAWKTFIVS